MPDITGRVSPGRSDREVVAVRDHVGHEIGSTLYFFAQRRVLAASLTGTPGNVVAELSNPLVESEPVSNERLGYVAFQSLLSYRSEPVPNLRDFKRTDWVTYRASGAKSVRAFEASSTRVSIATDRDDLRIEAQHQLTDESCFSVRGSVGIDAEHEELGALLRKLVAEARAARDAGVV